MEFWVSLIKTKERNDFIKTNMTHVTGNYFIYEGMNELIQDYLSKFEIVKQGSVPSLGGLSEKELIQICDERFGIDVTNLTNKEKQNEL